MLQAFDNDVSVRESALARLAAHRAANELTTGVLFWNGRAGSVAGCLIDSGDPSDWQASLHLAPWLAFALDAVTNHLDHDRAVEIAGRVLHAVPVGADTTAFGSRVVLQVLARLPELPTAQDGQVLHVLHGLHERCVAGDTPANADWRTARGQATALTDAIESEALKAIGECIEAAGWDPRSSPSSVGDVLRLWWQVLAANTDADLDWTKEKDDQVRAGLQRMHDTYIKDKPEGKRDVFMLLREHEPELESALLAYTLDKRRIQQDYLMKVGALLEDTLRGSN